MYVFGKEAKLECCYDFLCSLQTDSIDDIRAKMLFYEEFASNYNYVLYEYFSNMDLSNSKNRKLAEKEYKKLELFQRITYDSYLAILLHRSGIKQFKNIIVGLCSYFECSDAKIDVPFKNIIDKDVIISEMTKETYINNLKISQHSSTNVGAYNVTSSLGSIIEIEDENISSSKKIRYLSKSKLPVYGELKIFK